MYIVSCELKTLELKKGREANKLIMIHCSLISPMSKFYFSRLSFPFLSLYMHPPPPPQCLTSINFWYFQDAEVCAEHLGEPCVSHSLDTYPSKWPVNRTKKTERGLRLYMIFSSLWTYLPLKGCKLHCQKLCVSETPSQCFHWKLKKTRHKSLCTVL